MRSDILGLASDPPVSTFLFGVRPCNAIALSRLETVVWETTPLSTVWQKAGQWLTGVHLRGTMQGFALNFRADAAHAVAIGFEQRDEFLPKLRLRVV